MLCATTHSSLCGSIVTVSSCESSFFNGSSQPLSILTSPGDPPTSSAGHACLFQYIMLHLAGYKTWTLAEIQRYHSRNFKTSKAAGHPEIEQDIGIEVTTGPLVRLKRDSIPFIKVIALIVASFPQGQGIANSVGMAIAAKQLGATYNKPGHDLVSNTIWCFTGDGCLQEGIGQEGEGIVITPFWSSLLTCASSQPFPSRATSASTILFLSMIVTPSRSMAPSPPASPRTFPSVSRLRGGTSSTLADPRPSRRRRSRSPPSPPRSNPLVTIREHRRS